MDIHVRRTANAFEVDLAVPYGSFDPGAMTGLASDMNVQSLEIAAIVGQRHFESPIGIRYCSDLRFVIPPSLLPRNRERRWPTGRMRGLSRMSTCKKSPFTPTLSPNLFATTLQRKTTQSPQTNRGRGGKVALSNLDNRCHLR